MRQRKLGWGGRCCLAAPLAVLVMAAFAGCPAQNGGTTNEAFFPANYRSTYTLVRDCRNSIEHAATVRVWVNDVGAQAYLDDANPLPVGTVVIKEQFAAANCDDDGELYLWSVMRKESPGFDPVDGDWNWQDVQAPSRNVVISGKATCITCHAVQECRIRDYMCTEP